MLVTLAGFLFLSIIGFTQPSHAQVVMHPLSEISPTVKYYSYDYLLSSTQMKKIKYMIVLASNSDVKTVFNACDVCYQANKGYSQSGTDVRCNNCGNRFTIDGLGNKNTSGTCNPGYLPHSIEGDQVVLKISDLLTGAYYFPTETITSVDSPPLTSDAVQLIQTSQELTVLLPQDRRRTFRIYGIDGRLLTTRAASSRTVRIVLAGYTPGAYFLVIADAGEVVSKRFLVQ